MKAGNPVEAFRISQTIEDIAALYSLYGWKRWSDGDVTDLEVHSTLPKLIDDDRFPDFGTRDKNVRRESFSL